MSLHRFILRVCDSRWAWMILLAIVYACFFGYFIGTAEVASDDGHWSRAAMAMATGQSFSWLGQADSMGLFNMPQLSSMINAIFYAITPSHYAMVWGIFLINLVAHYFIIRTGEMIDSFFFGVCCSLAFAFRPSFFVFYSYKTWQLCYFPVALAGFYYALLAFGREGRRRHFIGSIIALAFAWNMHGSSFLLFPLWLAIVFYRRRDCSILSLILGMLGLLVSLTPLLLQRPFIDTSFAVLGASAIVFVLAWSRRWAIPISWPKINPSLLLILSMGLITTLQFHSFQIPSFKIFLDLLGANSGYIHEHIGMETMYPFIRYVESIELLLLIVYVAWNSRQREQVPAMLYFLIMASGLGLLATQLILQRESYPHQWFIYLFPLCLFGVLYPLRRSRVALSALIALGIGFSLFFSLDLQRTGGRGIHLASLKTKLTIIDFIRSHSSRPGIVFENVDAYGVHGWIYLLDAHLGSPPSSPPYDRMFYILEDRYMNRPNTTPSAMTGLSEFRVQGHRVFYSSF